MTTGAEPYVAQIDWSRDTAPWSSPPDEDGWSKVPDADDAEEAAENYAERYDRDGDYTIAGTGSGRVWVKGPDGTVTRWEVHGESVPTYYARAAR